MPNWHHEEWREIICVANFHFKNFWTKQKNALLLKQTSHTFINCLSYYRILAFMRPYVLSNITGLSRAPAYLTKIFNLFYVGAVYLPFLFCSFSWNRKRPKSDFWTVFHKITAVIKFWFQPNLADGDCGGLVLRLRILGSLALIQG